MEYRKQSSTGITPRLIIHGGAGNILPSNLPPLKYKAYHDSLLRILAETHRFLTSPSSFPLETSASATALDTVTYAVTQLENNPLFNSGHGAVFTRDGVNELEASVMVSKGKKKRGVGLMGLQHVKNPIKLAREMLIRGEKDLEGGNGEHRGPMAHDVDGNVYSTGAQGHSQLHKFSAEKLAEQWGLEMVEPEYFFVQARWDEHIKGLEKEKKGGDSTWDEEHFFPQGTCGAVALDSAGVVAVATSTGGMTNKLTGRIGDTPTLGAGFWAEEWEEEYTSKAESLISQPGPALILSGVLKGMMADCFPNPMAYSPIQNDIDLNVISKNDRVFRSTAMSGTGNGDSFLRINAVRTASAIARYRGSKSQKTSLQEAITEISGPGGDLVKSAGDRWRKTGEGEGGIIGIELTVLVDEDGNKKSAVSHIVDDYNCGGMFRAAVDKHGKAVMRVWKPNQHKGMEAYEGEGKEYDLRDWIDEKIQ
ncbi:N-terminal nucleophile aminohydrolases (Ntn hydrolases) [Glarea lozoyensis ATCC 20868]|uniref:N-terminal nucleophile aminohydrolases (Ntn hydrolases) n=1 Tax=Glarea lozoyensis (strain ATCC 20868 / MF5171) TaxID=1116229 RepID=S3CGM3_GLAL2|nr:N-terminal nucleophile aminohydrolases (Ntn hydrolases) [Glarea lozoyensis ATCC 20868]EPE25657.1 N-terminal nucleophile aminohydrolases (Ntn hydrolases) [Glarea lozoyensis ATCC 20868]